MKYMKVWAAMAAAGALAVGGCGDDESTDSASSAAGNPVDRAFVADMVPHHQSAVEMAKIAQQRGESTFVKRLADDIMRTQNEEISLMRREDAKLAAAGVERGSLGVEAHMKGMHADTAALKTAEPFDKAFIDMMIPHHEGAVTMARAELSKGKSVKLKTLAQDIITAQEREIDAMRAHLGDDSMPGEHGDPEGGHSG